jgi:hypothetical protein
VAVAFEIAAHDIAHHDVVVGDALDFWRVTNVVPGRTLELRAEMKLPGIATLTVHVEPEGHGSRLGLTARFQPRGLLGILYWYAVLPLHGLVFAGMLRGLKRTAERSAKSAKDEP